MSRKTSTSVACLQLAFLGGKGTGKASLIHHVLGNGYNEHQGKPDVSDMWNKTIAIPGMMSIVIMDTSDLHNFPPMKRVAIQRANIFVLVFALDDERSFREMENYYNDIMEIKRGSNEYVDNKVPIVIVGNKSEVPIEQQLDKNDVIDKVVNQWDCKYIETSAKTGDNIKAFSETMEEEIREAYGIKKPANKKQRKVSVAMKLKSIFA